MENKVINISPSTIETIDASFLKYVDEQMNLFCTTPEGFSKVPVIWSSAERAYQIKNNREIRDSEGSLIPPIISIERISLEKDPERKGIFWSNLSPKNDRYVITKQINQEKTSNFANADSLKRTQQGKVNFKINPKNKKIVYQSWHVPIPVYVSVTYEINLITNYQQQMNELLQPFITKKAQNYFILEHESHRYEGFIDTDFSQDSLSNLEFNERQYKAKIKVRVLGNLIGDGVNQEKSDIIIKENAVEVKFPREQGIFSEKLVEELDKKPRRTVFNPTFPINTPTETISITKKTFTIGDGINSVYSLVHNLNTRDVIVSIRENFSPYSVVYGGVEITSIDSVEIDFGNVILTNSYCVTIIG